jgi:hypothetical protein
VIGEGRSQLVVERVHKLSQRPWIFVTGRLEGEPLTLGQQVTIRRGDEAIGAATIESIEIHSAPGATTVAIDASFADRVSAGSVLVSP